MVAAIGALAAAAARMGRDAWVICEADDCDEDVTHLCQVCEEGYCDEHWPAHQETHRVFLPGDGPPELLHAPGGLDPALLRTDRPPAPPAQPWWRAGRWGDRL